MNTSKIEQLEAQLTALQAELNKLKERENTSETWPKVGDQYYYMCAYGQVESDVFEDHECDQGAQAIGNMFRTYQEAEKELEARKVIAELRSQPECKKFEPGYENYCVIVDLTDNGVATDYWFNDANGFGQAYFNTREDAENAIETVGKDRILAAAKWLAMGV